jgi:hypothetical protein
MVEGPDGSWSSAKRLKWYYGVVYDCISGGNMIESSGTWFDKYGHKVLFAFILIMLIDFAIHPESCTRASGISATGQYSKEN